MSKLNMLLLSSSRSGYEQEISDLFQASPEHPKTILFVGYATKDQEKRAKQVEEAMAPLGITVISAHTASDPVSLLNKVDGVYVGGGNTFRLLDQLQKTGLLDAIKKKVEEGMPYMGASAGINVVCPTIMTTNDMPIVQPTSFKAMGLVPFQINPHFTYGQSYYGFAGDITLYEGETRSQRIIQFHEESDIAVIGLLEKSALRIKGDSIELLGGKAAQVFQKGVEPKEMTDVAFLLKSPAKKPVPKGPGL